MPHVIRLRGPWQYQVLARTVLLDDGNTADEPGDLPPPGRVEMPCDWGKSLGSEFRGRVRYTRFFHQPTGLEPGEPVSLLVGQVDAWATVWLNGDLLGELHVETEVRRFDVTDKLLERNQLTIDVELPRRTAASAAPTRRAGRVNKPGGLVGDVWLEIG